MARQPKDRAPWLLSGCLTLAIWGTPTLLPRAVAQAQAPQVTMAGATAHAASADDGDGDGDELLEHWGDPRYVHEQRLQLTGLAVFFAGAGILSYRRRANLGRNSRHG